MWLITGPFDDAVTTTKTKLLKTGRKISLGRRDKQLVVNNKKISRDHCEFTVGPCTEENVSDPSFVATLEIYNAKEKPLSIDRDGLPVIVNPSSSSELKSGDKINIVVGITLEVQWRSIVCFLPPARSVTLISNDDCATLGITLLTSPSPIMTHYLTPKYELTIPLVTSLLSATQLVKAEWLQELIRLGTTPDNDHPLKLTPLEQAYSPPHESRYRPAFSPSLTPSLKSFKYWEPNEERLHFFKGYRFVVLSDAEGQIDEEARDFVVRGDGEYECFPLTNGDAKWRQTLAKAKRRVDESSFKVAIVARQRVQAAVGAVKWRQMTAEAHSLSLPLISVETLMDAVINTNISLLDAGSSTKGSSLSESESLPDFVPNTHPDEPSLPPVPEKAKEEIRAKSPSPSPPSMILGLPVPPPPSKNLLRRSRPPSRIGKVTEPVASGSKDDSAMENGTLTLPPPIPLMRPTRLKRRSPGPSALVEDSIRQTDQDQEPPLKKFKALFDATDPEKLTLGTASLPDTNDIVIGDFTQSGESLTQSDSRPARSQVAMPTQTLDVVAEEEEESIAPHARVASLVPLRPSRKSPLLPDAQRQHTDRAHDSRATGKPPSKQAKSNPTQDHGMDTDQAFLKALASRKGKKKAGENEFDREFDNLRISKPDIHREEEEKAWEVLGDFDIDERNMRGNFMVVLEMDVFRKDSSSRNAAAVTHNYDGRENHKKFKKTPSTFSLRAPIELIGTTEHDYGVGPGYWKDSATLDDRGTQAPTQTAGIQRPRAPMVLESDSAESDVPVERPTKRTARKAPPSKAKAKAKKLFLDSDEEASGPATDPKEAMDTEQPEPAPARINKRRHIIADDDSDDGVAFKGFGKKRRVR